MSVPSTIVIRPEASSTSGNGSPVAKNSRAATQLASARRAICPSDTRPVRPIRMPSPSATTV